MFVSGIHQIIPSNPYTYTLLSIFLTVNIQTVFEISHSVKNTPLLNKRSELFLVGFLTNALQKSQQNIYNISISSKKQPLTA